ncbi:MAG TPA: VWA domain-containing protein [Bryobacteraceae bacterium]|nr:VWA domain-containing protein [Bryobacteraceae bacterium]
MNKFPAFATFLTIGTAAVFLVSAQQPQPPQPGTNADSSAGVTFKAQTQLVVETVTVKDKNGKAIEGLTAKDFTVTEDGAVQTIQFCDFQKLDEIAPSFATRPAPAPAPAAPSDNPPKPKVQGTTTAQIASETPGDLRFKNRRLLVLYFDMSAMPVPDQLRAFAAAQKFIKSQMTPADLMAVMKYDAGAIKVLDDFTDDRDELQMTIDKLVAGEGSGFDEATNDDSTADTGAAFGQDDSEFNIFNTDRQLAAIQTAVKMLGSLNEKKSLVYFASGMRLNGINNQAQMQATVNAAIRSNVVLFPIDARGLVAGAPLGDATVGSPGGVGMYSGSSAIANTNNFQRSQDTLYTLAADTGGKALLDYNDLTLGIVHAQEAISSYYVVGYQSTKPTLDGKYRRIKITYNGDPSAKLEYRQGYFAGKLFSKFTATDKERQLEDALMLGDPITELTIAMEVDYFQLNRAEYYVPVAIKIPGSELALARRGGAEHTVIDFIGEVKDEYGTTVSNVRDKVDAKLTGQTAAELASRPILYDTGFTLLPATYTIKVLARDDETGRIGTYMQKFTVPNLNKEEKRIPISSVVIGSQFLAFNEALYNAAKDKGKSEVVSPLVQDGQKLLPSVTRVFSRNRDMHIYLQAYEQTVENVQPLVAFVTFYRGQTKAFETPPLPVNEAVQNRLKTMPMKFSIPLNKLQPGRYNCQVTVLNPEGQKAAFWQAPIMLVP